MNTIAPSGGKYSMYIYIGNQHSILEDRINTPLSIKIIFLLTEQKTIKTCIFIVDKNVILLKQS